MFRFDCTFSNFNCTKRVQLHTILRPVSRVRCVEVNEWRPIYCEQQNDSSGSTVEFSDRANLHGE